MGRNIGAKQTKTQRTNKGKKMKWTKNKKLTRENQGSGKEDREKEKMRLRGRVCFLAQQD